MDNVLSTEAYFDPTAGTFQIVTPRNFVVKAMDIPADVLDSPRERQETWVRTQIRKNGGVPSGRPTDYPWGFFYRVGSNG